MGPRRHPILQPSPALTFLAPWRPAALALLAVLLASTAVAQTGRVLVQRRDNVELRVRPGASGTAVFRVSNPGAAPTVFRPAASLPAGWAAVATEGAAQLAPGARAIRFVGFAVPRDAHAGAYTVRLAAPGQPGDSVRVIVAALRELSLRTRDAPRFVVGGDPYVARFTLENRGNGAERITLRVVSSGGLAATLDSARIVLAPGGVLDVPVRVATARRTAAVVGHLVELHARAAGDSTVAARASSRVEVVPRGAGASGRGRLPIEVRLRNGAGGTPLAAVSGAGTLVRGGSSRVEFLARPADAPGSFLGEPDEYRARFVGRGVDLRAGDQVYSLSPLTQPGRYGFGAGGSVEAGPVTAGGFVVRDRRSVLPLEERGGAVALGGRRGSVGAQYLSRTGTDAGTVGSARVRLSPFRQWSLDAEYGSGAGVLGRGAASSVVLQAITGRASLFARHLQADSSYPAYFAGERVDEAVLQLRPWRSLLLAGSGLRRRDSAPGLLGGGPSRNLLVGSIGWGNALTAEYRSESRIGVDRTESVGLRGMYRFGPAWLSPRAEVGRTESLITPLHLPYHRVSAYGGFDFRRQSISGWVEHSNRQPYAPSILDDGGVLLATLNASLHPTRGTRLQATFQGTRSDDSGEWRYGTGEVGVWQQLARGHRIVARARWGLAGPGVGDAPRFLIDYVIPIGVPTPRGGEDGRVAGRI
ncbi:MAG TPA: NEW3 domain-containing protein, partial [Longimicrobium sp.]|nr:NEW3 domain-containing protein [Longimicrobium sp.]